MIINCKNCSRKFIVKDTDIPSEGRTVKCGYCSVTWHQSALETLDKVTENQNKLTKVDVETITEVKSQENISIDAIKASDGKTYKFLGTQWAQLLPSGKTGLFAKKKIGSELDKITGRKKIKNSRKKIKKKEVNPSSEVINNIEKSDVDKKKTRFGFFSYFFLLIVISFSTVGALKTFEYELINYFPEAEYYYMLLDGQLEYVVETVKNIIIIVEDLINSY
jgi:predicted Zn finger-like uncharacterized protein